jgi:hypothetical protein
MELFERSVEISGDLLMTPQPGRMYAFAEKKNPGRILGTLHQSANHCHLLLLRNGFDSTSALDAVSLLGKVWWSCFQ